MCIRFPIFPKGQGFQNSIKGWGVFPQWGEWKILLGDFLKGGGNLRRSNLTMQTFFKAKNNILNIN